MERLLACAVLACSLSPGVALADASLAPATPARAHAPMTTRWPTVLPCRTFERLRVMMTSAPAVVEWLRADGAPLRFPIAAKVSLADENSFRQETTLEWSGTLSADFPAGALTTVRFADSPQENGAQLSLECADGSGLNWWCNQEGCMLSATYQRVAPPVAPSRYARFWAGDCSSSGDPRFEQVRADPHSRDGRRTLFAVARAMLADLAADLAAACAHGRCTDAARDAERDARLAAADPRWTLASTEVDRPGNSLTMNARITGSSKVAVGVFCNIGCGLELTRGGRRVVYYDPADCGESKRTVLFTDWNRDDIVLDGRRAVSVKLSGIPLPLATAPVTRCCPN